MRKARRMVVVLTVLALLLSDAGEADGRRCKRRRRCRRPPQPPAPAPVVPGPTPIVFEGGAPISNISALGSSRLTVPSQGVKHVVDVNLVLKGVTAVVPDDLDISLSKDDAHATTVMDDVGGTTAVENLDLTFDDESARSISDDGPLASGTYRPTTSPAAAARLARLDGVDPAGTWFLSVRGPSASLAGWSLALTLADGAATPPSRAPAPPPPGPDGTPVTEWFFTTEETTAIPDQGFTVVPLDVPDQGNRRIEHVRVGIYGMAHTNPDDLDVTVVHIAGRARTNLMSDVGGSHDISIFDVGFEDGRREMPDEGPLVVADYRPTRGTPSDPDDLRPNALSTFNGLEPSGRWVLVLADDRAGEAGSIRKWGVELTMR